MPRESWSKAGADVNAKDDTEQCAYLIATSEGYLELLELTLRHGADVGSLDSYQGTGLIRTADRGHAGCEDGEVASWPTSIRPFPGTPTTAAGRAAIHDTTLASSWPR